MDKNKRKKVSLKKQEENLRATEFRPEKYKEPEEGAVGGDPNWNPQKTEQKEGLVGSDNYGNLLNLDKKEDEAKKIEEHYPIFMGYEGSYTRELNTRDLISKL